MTGKGDGIGAQWMGLFWVELGAFFCCNERRSIWFGGRQGCGIVGLSGRESFPVIAVK